VTLPSFHVHVDVWLVLGSVAAAYLVAIRRHAASTGMPVDRRHRAMFLTGIAIVLFASTWPVHDLAEDYLYSVHMVQHLLYTLVAAPLLVAGTPAWLWRRLLAPAPVRVAWRVLTRPLVALLLFNGVLLFTHWPQVVEASVGSELTHFALHVLIVGSALVMWWPVVSPLPEMPPLTPPGQMLYLFFQSIAPTIPASFLTFGHTVLYAPYATFPRIWGWSAIDDQMLAGLFMKIVGGLILWGVIAAVFFRWSAREERDGWDALQWRDVDAEVRAELSR
jgi:putative membrane protein